MIAAAPPPARCRSCGASVKACHRVRELRGRPCCTDCTGHHEVEDNDDGDGDGVDLGPTSQRW